MEDLKHGRSFPIVLYANPKTGDWQFLNAYKGSIYEIAKDYDIEDWANPSLQLRSMVRILEVWRQENNIPSSCRRQTIKDVLVRLQYIYA